MMKKYDVLWALALISIVFILIFPSTHELFLIATKRHPYIMGFIKVGILATMGELLALRILTGNFKKPVGISYRFIIWGFLGMVFVLIFDLYAFGVAGTIEKGLLPSFSNDLTSKLLTAFFTSLLINIFFAPTFMAFHRITDTYIDLGEGNLKNMLKVSLRDVIKEINWYNFINFIVLKTIPFFWIPAHTITFLLSPEYRVLMAAMLSIALGAILAFSKKNNKALER